MSNTQRYAVEVEYQISVDCEVDVDMDDFAEFLADNPGSSISDYIKEMTYDGELLLPNPDMGEMRDYYIDASPIATPPQL